MCQSRKTTKPASKSINGYLRFLRCVEWDYVSKFEQPSAQKRSLKRSREIRAEFVFDDLAATDAVLETFPVNQCSDFRFETKRKGDTTGARSARVGALTAVRFFSHPVWRIGFGYADAKLAYLQGRSE